MIYESASLKELLPLPPFFAKTTWLLRSIERDKVPDQISFFSILAAAVAAAAEMRENCACDKMDCIDFDNKAYVQDIHTP